jgi:hypothetical protein
VPVGDLGDPAASAKRYGYEAGLAAEEVAGKEGQAGDRGYPIGTVAFYGPDDLRASKAAVGIIAAADAEPVLRTWLCESGDIRNEDTIVGEIAMFLRGQDVRSVAMPSVIIGCPHEEGIDYPEGEACPQCPFWKGRDRWAGVVRR